MASGESLQSNASEDPPGLVLLGGCVRRKIVLEYFFLFFLSPMLPTKKDGCDLGLCLELLCVENLDFIWK